MASGRVGARTAARISLARPLSPPASAHATATPPRRPHTWASNPQRRLEQAVRLRVGHSLLLKRLRSPGPCFMLHYDSEGIRGTNFLRAQRLFLGGDRSTCHSDTHTSTGT